MAGFPYFVIVFTVYALAGCLYFVIFMQHSAKLKAGCRIKYVTKIMIMYAAYLRKHDNYIRCWTNVGPAS